MADTAGPSSTVRQDPEALRLFVEGMRDYAIFMLDRHGRVVSWNQGAECIFGYSAPEIIGRPFADFFTPDQARRGAPAEELREATERGQTQTEQWHVRKDGTRFWATQVVTALRNEKGELQCFAKVLRDITDRKRLEEELRRQASELAETNRRKDELLAMLSHELRNPLAPVLNAVHVLNLAPDDPAVVREASAMIERQIRHMARLIDDLLEVTRVVRGKILLRREPTELNNLVRRAADGAAALMKERRHAFEVRPEADALWVDADPVRLEQVLSHLLHNAAKYTDPGGQVCLTVGREGGEAVLGVRDTGMGIHPNMLPIIFDLFTQEEHSLDRSRGGLGIGLTLVKRLVEMHGGRIEARSDGPEQGSTFLVHLPTIAAPSPADGPGPPQKPGRRLRVLVVDDNTDSAASLAMLLRLHGHEVDVCHDGETGLATAQRGSFEVVMLDIGLPKIDGYEMARRLRASGDGKPLLVAISGYGSEEDLHRSRQAGFDHHLVKPADPTKLEELLRRMWT